MATSVPLRGDPPNPVGDDSQTLQGHCGPHASPGRAPGEGDTAWRGQAAPSVPLSGSAGHELYVTDSATQSSPWGHSEQSPARGGQDARPN